MTIVARSARIAAGTDQLTRQGDGADSPGEGRNSRARGRRAEGATTAESGIITAYRQPPWLLTWAASGPPRPY
jgi:hypothetical protein